MGMAEMKCQRCEKGLGIRHPKIFSTPSGQVHKDPAVCFTYLKERHDRLVEKAQAVVDACEDQTLNGHNLMPIRNEVIALRAELENDNA